MTINIIGSSASVTAITQAASQRTEKTPFAAVSDLLGMSTDEITSAVAGGKSLMDLADEKGVSSEDLLSALEDGAPDDLKASDQLREIVTRIANQKGGPEGPGGPGGPGGPPPGPPPGGRGDEASGVTTDNLTETQSSTLDVLSSLLDMDSDDLTGAIKDGSLTDLLAEAGVDLTDLSTALETALAGSTTGFQVDVRA